MKFKYGLISIVAGTLSLPACTTQQMIQVATAKDPEKALKNMAERRVNSYKYNPELIVVDFKKAKSEYDRLMGNVTANPGGPASMIDKSGLVRFGEGLVHAEDVAEFRVSGIGSALPMLARGCRSQLLPDGLGRFEKADIVVHRFRHFGFPVCPHDSRGLGEMDLGFREDLSKTGIKSPGDFPGEFYMLDLIFSDGNITRLIDQDIGRLEHRVIEKPHVNILPVLFRLLFKLGHPFQLADRRHTIEDPGQFGMSGDMGLDKDGAPIRRQTTGRKDGHRIQNPLLQGLHFIFDGDGMIVHNYERRHTRELDAMGGLAKVMPMYATVFVIVAMSSIGLPGTNGFVGEFLVLVGSFPTQPWYAFVAATSVIFAAAYLLWAVQRIIYNPLVKPENEALKGHDLNWREIGLMLPLLLTIVWMGVYPKPT